MPVPVAHDVAALTKDPVLVVVKHSPWANTGVVHLASARVPLTVDVEPTQRYYVPPDELVVEPACATPDEAGFGFDLAQYDEGTDRLCKRCLGTAKSNTGHNGTAIVAKLQRMDPEDAGLTPIGTYTSTEAEP